MIFVLLQLQACPEKRLSLSSTVNNRKMSKDQPRHHSGRAGAGGTSSPSPNRLNSSFRQSCLQMPGGRAAVKAFAAAPTLSTEEHVIYRLAYKFEFACVYIQTVVQQSYNCNNVYQIWINKAFSPIATIQLAFKTAYAENDY